MEKLEANNLLAQLDINQKILSENNSINYRIRYKAFDLFNICDKLTSVNGMVTISTDDMNKIHTFLNRLKSDNWEYIDERIESSQNKIELLSDVLNTLTKK